ncbi:sigma-54 dependent transcriptional regulator [Flagellatimonas centrodinii]|uniref:sigma-54-dependent transcriptional regulator n=1 Tax=Flagellatimonas centrodinii TaxID=2806210 RepID=UPI001FEFAB52|nr:sigma-54 dependent transcriptional regulator [Flagellatimonas centrodinii]ULQ45331.1 sigma-54 dependent transcriptional regulator [Flagellatimonas centrodinii]
MKAAVLIVDDEADIRELVEITLSRMGLTTEAAGSLAEAHDRLACHSFDLCITDMRLPDGSGIDLVRHIGEHCADTPVAVITAYGSAQAAVESLKAGAFDFVSKPVDLQVLRKLVRSALDLRGAAVESRGTEPTGLLGQHPSIDHLRQLVGRLARSQAPVHIAGESGTGKELVARMIHAQSPRAVGAFVPVNCGAIPSELMESEFFGHLKGAFTGAIKDKTGLFQAAEGGTLFLDEVADLPLHMQVKLLRALQERAIRPVGSDSEQPVNVRVISATHESLEGCVADGRFRQDLYYRLNVIEVRTPPLRDRSGDIPLLTHHILERLARTNGWPRPPTLDDAALARLVAYPFPGNVRELENILERALTLCDGRRITATDLQLRETAALTPAGAPALDSQMDAVERQAILEALEKARFNKTRAAELLGMSFRSLRYRIKKLGLDV